MKIINKLVPALCAAGAAAGIVVPLTTSCSAGQTYNYHITSSQLGVKAIPIKAKTANITNATSIYLNEVAKNNEILANDMVLDVAYWSSLNFFTDFDHLKDLNVDISIKIEQIDVESGRLSFSLDETFSYRIQTDISGEDEWLAISGHYNFYSKNFEYIVTHEGKTEEDDGDVWNLRPKFAYLSDMINTEYIPDKTRHNIITAYLQGQPDWEFGATEFVRLDDIKYNIFDEHFKFTRNVFDAELLAEMCDGTPDLLSIGHRDGLASMRAVVQDESL